MPSESQINTDLAASTPRPIVPSPNASSTTMREFLTQLLMAFDPERTRADAETQARKIKGDGQAIYGYPLRVWTAAFQDEGLAIYDVLQKSEYGYDGGYWPYLTVLGAILFALGILNGASQLWIETDLRKYTFPIICTFIVTGLILFNLACKSKRLIDCERFPNRLKIRQSSAQAGQWNLWPASTS